MSKDKPDEVPIDLQETDDGRVRLTIEKATLTFPQELRPVERIIAGLVEFLDGFYLVEKKGKKLKGERDK